MLALEFRVVQQLNILYAEFWMPSFWFTIYFDQKVLCWDFSRQTAIIITTSKLVSSSLNLWQFESRQLCFVFFFPMDTINSWENLPRLEYECLVREWASIGCHFDLFSYFFLLFLHLFCFHLKHKKCVGFASARVCRFHFYACAGNDNNSLH